MSVPAKQSPARLHHAFWQHAQAGHPLGSQQVPARSLLCHPPHPALTQMQHLGGDQAEAEVGHHVGPVSCQLAGGETVPANPGAHSDVEPGVLTLGGLR